MNFIVKCWEAIVKCFKWLWKLVRLYWDILGGAISGMLLSWIGSWKFDNIQTIYAIIILILVCIGLFKVLKNNVDKKAKRKKVMLDAIVNNQKPIKAINIATKNPTKSGEELGEIIIETAKGWKRVMEKIKKFFIWIGRYWQQILGIAGSLAEYGLYVWFLLSDKLQPIFDLLPQEEGWQIGSKITLSVLVALIVILQIRNMCKWVGVGSLKDAEEYIAQKAEETKTKLSGESKKKVEGLVKQLKTNLKETEKKIKTLKGDLEKIEKDIVVSKELITLGCGSEAQYRELQQEKNKVIYAIQENENQAKSFQAEITKYKNVL